MRTSEASEASEVFFQVGGCQLLELVVIADDLTGALDTGAQFAAAGKRTRVTWPGGEPAEAEVLVLDTESREVSADEAAERVRAAVQPYLAARPRFYKKVDSTLRGNIGAELRALQQACGAERIVFAPAFPAQGRTVEGGALLVGGRPLSETPFVAPGCDGTTVAALLAPQFAGAHACVALPSVRAGHEVVARAVAAEPASLLVLDAAADSDLACIARAATQMGKGCLLAGSAGLAGQLPQAWGWPAPENDAALPAVTGPLLIVAGSHHPALAAQVARLAEVRSNPPGGGRLTVVDDLLPGLLKRNGGLVDQRATEAAAALRRGDDVLLTTVGAPLIAGGERAIRALLGQVAARALGEVRPGALVIVGGATAAAVCANVDCAAIELGGDVEPGIPWSTLRGGVADGLLLVTKSGGFGDAETLLRVRRRLRGEVNG